MVCYNACIGLDRTIEEGHGMTNEEFNLEDKISIAEFPMSKFEKFLRNQIANDLEQIAIGAMISNEYNFNDTAVRAKTYHHAAEIVRGRPSER